MAETKFVALSAILFIVGLLIGYVVYPVVNPPPEVVEVPEVVGLTGTVRIGLLVDLSGGLSTYGENSRAAAELAEQEINEYLAEIGAGWTLEVVVEDTATDPATALSKLETLFGRGILFVAGPMSSGEVKQLKTFVDANNILLISMSSTAPELGVKGGEAMKDFVFRYCPTDVIQGPAAARILIDMGIRYYIPVWRGDTWGDGLELAQAEAFEELLDELGLDGEVLEGIRYDPEATVFTTEAADLASRVQEAIEQYGRENVGVVIIGFKEVAAFFTAANDHPILKEVIWVGSDGTAGLAELLEPIPGEFAYTTKFTNPIFAPGASPWRDKVKAYVERELGRTPDSYAYATYDIIWTLALALLQVNEYDPVKVREVLPDIVKRYNGATGTFELDEYGDRAFADYEIWVVWPTDGGYDWRVAGMYRAATDSIEWEAWWREAVMG